MKSRIVGSLSEFAKDEPLKKAQDLMEDLRWIQRFDYQIQNQITTNQSILFMCF
jgi:hypothetical protein